MTTPHPPQPPHPPHSEQPQSPHHPAYPQPHPHHPGGQPPIVHVINKPGGFGRAVGVFITSVFVLGCVLFIGMIFGIFVGFAGTFATGMESMVIAQNYRTGSGDTIAVIPVSGVISAPQADFIRRAVKFVQADSRYKAVVLQVDSPGGDPTSSDQIWYQIEQLKQEGIPIIASFGGVAASGGYYISCGCEQIIAEETCITGSIGVIAQVFTMEGLMDKVGIQPVTLVASNSPEKDLGNPFRAWTDEDRERIRILLDSTYDIFLDRVSVGRGHVIKDPEVLREVANGDIYTAAEALNNGLIDAIGYLDDAIVLAETAANLTAGQARVDIITEPPSIFDDYSLLQGSTTLGNRSLDAEAARAFMNDLSQLRIMYLMP